MKNKINQNFDAIIVGTGPGGATTAKELTNKGKKVLILEWGPYKPLKGSFIDYVFQQLLPGKCMLITNQFLGMVRGITTGGSSLFYYGTAFPVPHEMMKKYDPEKLKDGFNILDGEKIFYISNPGMGLWSWKERFK